MIGAFLAGIVKFSMIAVSHSRESGCVIYFSRDYKIFYTDKEFARKNYGIIGAMIAVSQPRSP